MIITYNETISCDPPKEQPRFFVLVGLPPWPYALATNLRPGEAPDGSCAFDIVAACTSEEALVAAATLLGIVV